MKRSKWEQAIIFLAAGSLLALVAIAGPKDFWETKPYTEWSAKEVEKILLKNSPWTFVLLLNSPSSVGSIGSVSSGSGGGSGPPPIYFNWYARPIREAIARQMMLQAPETKKEQLDALLNHSSQYLEIALTGYVPGRSSGGGGFGGGGGRRGGGGNVPTAPAKEETPSMTKFKEETHLLRKDKVKIPLVNIVAPARRNAAYMLQFAKEIDGKPALSPDDKEVTLVIRINENVYKFAFKLDKMVVKGKLEI